LIHHFGSAAGLQAALARSMADHVNERIAGAIAGVREGMLSRTVIVDLVFDAFDSEGAGALTAWMVLSGDLRALDPVLEAISALVHRISDEAHPLPQAALGIILLALGGSLVGGALTRSLGLPADAPRDLAMKMMPVAETMSS
jgi:hypothetical protein